MGGAKTECGLIVDREFPLPCDNKLKLTVRQLALNVCYLLKCVFLCVRKNLRV